MVVIIIIIIIHNSIILHIFCLNKWSSLDITLNITYLLINLFLEITEL